MMPNLHQIALVIICGLMVSCQTSTDTLSDYYSQTNVVQLNNPSINLSAMRTFTVIGNPRLLHVGDEYDSRRVNYLLEKELFKQISAKGYQAIGNPNITDFYVTYTLAIEDGTTDIHINEKLGLNPGMNRISHNLNQYQKGTLILDVIERKTRHSAYRSALQGFAHLKINEEVRQQRLSRIISRLIDGMPDISQ